MTAWLQSSHGLDCHGREGIDDGGAQINEILVHKRRDPTQVARLSQDNVGQPHDCDIDMGIIGSIPILAIMSAR